HFGGWVAIVAAAALAAVVSTRLAERFRIPPGALFLLVAAGASDLFPSLSHLSIRSVERVVSVALAVILFDGGLRVGWRRFRGSAAPIVSLGLLGTFATAGLLALVAHFLLAFRGSTAGVRGAALAPTDPAIMFSVLGRREVAGRTGTILEGESGANDPVGIALTLAMISAAAGGGSAGSAVVDFVSSLLIGLAIGAVAARLVHPLLVRLPLRDASLGPLRTLAFVFVVFGVASLAHGSGFLAAYIAGVLVGDEAFPGKRAVARFHTSLASLAEIVAFVALGLTVHLQSISGDHVWADGLVLALLGILVVRPLAVAPLLAPVRLTGGERVFVLFAGLKGAVPILLASLALLGGVDHAERIYLIVFVVVALSVTFQAAAIPTLARRLGVPMLELREQEWE
ncbi:MAG: cation:proton antiporter, partial [Acidobacteriota bacterium]|nr:cation:proton antiporter [Acidobacteriota bacterium]